MTAFLFFLLSLALLFLMSLTGRASMGFQLPFTARPLARNQREILIKYFPYYHKLDRKQQRIFKQKMQYFIHIKEFIPRDIDKVTDEMKVLISACAVQLTFGYPKVMLSHFKRILIYPDNYYSTINKQYHKGEVNPRFGAIVLSWKNFVQGYIEDSSCRNLGLHEMAHAIRLENKIFNGEFDFLDQSILDEWGEQAEKEIKNIQAGNSALFRDYAGTNQDEFFAIAVENFFERPEQFKELMPKLFGLMTKILRQNPLNT